MTPFELLFFIISGLAAINCLFFSVYYFLSSSGRKSLNRLLALIFLTLALRVFKSIAVFLMGDIHPYYHYVWYLAIISTPVLTFLYVSNLLGATRGRAAAIAHAQSPLLLTVALEASISYIGWQWPIRIIATYIALYSLLTLLAFMRARKQETRAPGASRWIVAILIFLAVQTAVFGGFFFTSYNLLVVEPVVFTIALYLFAFVELRWKSISIIHRHDPLDKDAAEVLKRALLKAMEEDRLFLSPNLTLADLAKTIGTTPHLLSRLINSNFGRNYNDFINSYRIEHAALQLADTANRHSTVSTIAFECGFNSLSVFNNAFKKFKGMTPSQYRARHSEQDQAS